MDKNKKVIGWFTANKKHIPIYEGETTQQAFNRHRLDYEERQKQAQIEFNKKQAAILNGAPNDMIKSYKSMPDMVNASNVDPFTRMARHLAQNGISNEDEINRYLRRLSATRRSKLAKEMGITSRGDEKIWEMARKIYIAGKNDSVKPDSNYNSKSLGREYTAEEKIKLCEEFTQRTGLPFRIFIAPADKTDGLSINNIPSDTLDMTLSTIENHLNEYGKKNFILTEVRMRSSDFADDDYKNAMAMMSTKGVLSLNPKYFTKSKAELDQIMYNSAETKHHPVGDASSIIIHELGHARWNNAMISLWGGEGGTDVWDSMYNLSSNKEWTYGLYSIMNNDLYKNNKAYKNFVDKFYSFTEKVQDDYVKERNDTFFKGLSLYWFVSPERNWRRGISTYALTDIHEIMAEAWADVNFNKKDASDMSKRIVQEFLNVAIDI